MNDFSAGLRASVALEKYGFRTSHSLGQNFILDDDFLEEIAALSGVSDSDCVLEIGPGPGVLTSHLARRCKKVVSLEIDRKLEPVLADVLRGFQNAQIIFEDVMRCDLDDLLQQQFGDVPVHVVANLPYYITADVIERLLTRAHAIEDITVMVQKEAAERIAAKVGDKNYCALSMLVQYYCDVEALMDVPPERFVPQPHVMSRLIRLTRRTDSVRARDDAFLQRVIKSAFRMRRKTLVNNLSGDFPISREDAQQLLVQQGFDPRIRGEILTPDQIARLSDALTDRLQC